MYKGLSIYIIHGILQISVRTKATKIHIANDEDDDDFIKTFGITL